MSSRLGIIVSTAFIALGVMISVSVRKNPKKVPQLVTTPQMNAEPVVSDQEYAPFGKGILIQPVQPSARGQVYRGASPEGGLAGATFPAATQPSNATSIAAMPRGE